MIIQALILGLSTGVFCMGYCGPVLLGLLFSRQEQRWTGNVGALGLFLAGRLIAYLLFGVITYCVGELLKDSAFILTLFPVAEMVLGALMVLYALNLRFPHWALCHHTFAWSQGRVTLFAAGIFTGLNVCPPFLLAVETSLRSGSLFRSVAFFGIFFMATSLYLLPFLFSIFTTRSKNIRAAAQIVCGLTGFWYTTSGLLKLSGR